jgi:acyl dehydratase
VLGSLDERSLKRPLLGNEGAHRGRNRPVCRPLASHSQVCEIRDFGVAEVENGDMTRGAVLPGSGIIRVDDSRKSEGVQRLMKHKAHLGATTHKTVVIEQGLIQRFVDALDLGDPLSKDPEAARMAGLPGLVLPQSAAGSLGDFAYFLTLLELRPKQVLHSKELVQVFMPVCAGDELTITSTLRDLYEQQVGGNPMGFVTIDVTGTAKKGDVRFEAQRVLAIRGGFPRR